MSPKLEAILTVFVIGLISFLIGYLLTAARKSSGLKKLESDNQKLSNDISILKGDLDMRKKKVDRLRNDNTKVLNEKKELNKKYIAVVDEKDKLERKCYSPNGKAYKDEYEVMYERYIDEMDKRKDLEREKFDSLKGNSNSFSTSNKDTTNDTTVIDTNSFTKKSSTVETALSSLFSKVGFGNPLRKDDLTKISGIGPDIASKLNKIGFYNYKQIAKLTDKDLDVIDKAIQHFPGRALKDDWIGQAKKLVS